MTDLPFVDAHVHFHDLKQDGLTYRQFERDFVHPTLGDMDVIKSVRFDSDAYIAESRFAGVVKAVHVQAAVGTADPVVETLWLDAQASRTGFPNAIIAYADLRDDRVMQVLDRHAEASGRLRGIRDTRAAALVSDPAWQRGYSHLSQADLLFELYCGRESLAGTRQLAERFPDTAIVLEHAGSPECRTTECFQSWRRAMADFSSAENVMCKISGLGIGDSRWSVSSIEPWILECIEIFGIERCCFGSHWPMDRMYSSFDPLIEAYRAAISHFSSSEQTALFSSNAERIYKI